MSTHPPAPQLWLNLSTLLRSCDAATYSRGLDLYRNQHVMELRIEPLGDRWLLTGQVQGSQRQPYALSIEVKRGPAGQVLEWDSDCTCPVGYQCKHGVALMIKAAYKGAQLIAGHEPEDATHQKMTLTQVSDQIRMLEERAREIALQEAQAQVQRWLKELERSNLARTATHAQHPGPTQRNEQFLYLLDILGANGPNPLLTLEVTLSYPKVAGGWSKPKPVRFFPERGQPVYDLASATDHDLLQLIRAMPSSASGYYYSYNLKSKVTLEGRYGVEALQKAASTGRLFVTETRGTLSKPVQWGAQRTITWSWQQIHPSEPDSDLWTLHARLTEGDGQLCLNNPPLYLDKTRGLCGLLDTNGLSMGQLAALLKAPRMQAQALQSLQRELSLQLGNLPLPPVVEQVPTVSGLAPRVCLRLKPATPQNAGLHSPIEAHVSFA